MKAIKFTIFSVVLFAALTAKAQFLYLSGSRGIGGRYDRLTNPSFYYTAFGIYNQSVSSQTFFGSYSAMQNTSLDATGISGTMSASTSVNFTGFEEAEAASKLTAVFSFSSDSAFEFLGTGTGGAITLTGPGVSDNVDVFSTPSFDLTGTFQAGGQYTLGICMSLFVSNNPPKISTESVSETLNFSLTAHTVPEPSAFMYALVGIGMLIVCGSRNRSGRPRKTHRLPCCR